MELTQTTRHEVKSFEAFSPSRDIVDRSMTTTVSQLFVRLHAGRPLSTALAIFQIKHCEHVPDVECDSEY